MLPIRLGDHRAFGKHDVVAVLAGSPNAGKSSLIKPLANTRSKIADYAFAALDTAPVTTVYSNANM